LGQLLLKNNWFKKNFSDRFEGNYRPMFLLEFFGKEINYFATFRCRQHSSILEDPVGFIWERVLGSNKAADSVLKLVKK
jgi:hypothetical protein